MTAPVSRTGATDREVEAVALVCVYCGGELSVDQRTEGRPYLTYEVPDMIECADCDASWEPNGQPRETPKWMRYPDLYPAPARAALLAEQPGGER